MNQWIAILAVLVTLGVGLQVTGRCARRGLCSAETSRKGVHILLGAITLGFPWLFDVAWPVWVLAGLAVATLAAIRWGRPEHAPERHALQAVGRESYGEFCFPVAVAIVFSLRGGSVSSYLVSIAALTLADSAGALVGRRFGRHAYTTDEGTKTLEGSLAVLAVTAVVAFVLLPGSDVQGPGTRALMAMLVGAVTMVVEAVALRGFDNLFIPLLVWSLAERYALLDVPALVWRLLALATIALAMAWWRSRTRLNDAAAIACAMLFYMTFFTAGWAWMVPPATAAVSYTLLIRSRTGAYVHTLGAASTVLLPAYAWLLVHLLWPFPADYRCYVTALACAVSLMAVAEWNTTRTARWVRCAGAAALGTASGLPGLFMPPSGGAPTAADVGLLAALCFAAAAVLQIGELSRSVDHGRDARWVRQALLSTLLATGGAFR